MAPLFRSQLLGRRLRQDVARATDVIARRFAVAGREPIPAVNCAIVAALDGPERLAPGCCERSVVTAIAMYLHLFARHRFNRKDPVAQEAMFELVMHYVRSHADVTGSRD